MLPSGCYHGVSGDDSNNQLVNLYNLTAEQANGIGISHSTTGNNAIADTTLNAVLKTDTTADSLTISINEGVNIDPSFNFTLTNLPQGAVNQQVIESLTFVDADTESNSVALANVANYRGSITVGTAEGAGLAGTFINFDTGADPSLVNPNVRGWAGVNAQADGRQAGAFDHRGGYQLDVDGGSNNYSIANPTQVGANGSITSGNVDSVFTAANLGLTANVRYNTLDNGVANDVRIIAETFDASAENSDVIARFADVTRADGVSSMAVSGGAGNDTFIFDAQGVKNSGFTSGDSVAAGAGFDTLVIDGDTAAQQANLANGVGGNISVQKSEWDNVTGIDALRLAGNGNNTNGALAQAVANVGSNNFVASSVNAGGYYIEIDNEFVRQTDSGNNLKIISNDGDLSTNLESDLVLNLRDLNQTSNVTFVGANGNGLVGGLASNRLLLSDNSANPANTLDGGDTVVDAFEVIQANVGGVNYRASSGNNNVLEIFNGADVSINDLSKVKNFGRIEATNDVAIAQTLKLVLNDTIMDQLVDAGTEARIATTTGIPANIERLVVVANNNPNVAGAIQNLNINASAASNKFGLDVLVAQGSTNIITGTAGSDKVVVQGNYNALEQILDNHAGVNLFQGASAINGAALTPNGVSYYGGDNLPGTGDEILLADTSTYNLGAGDTLEVFGGLDLSGATVAAGTTILAHSTLRLTSKQFNEVSAINFVGPGPHALIIDNNRDTTPENAPNLNKVTFDVVGTVVNIFYGSEVPAGTNAPVLNDPNPPVFVSATVNGNTLVMSYTDANNLDAANPPLPGAFKVTAVDASMTAPAEVAVANVVVNAFAKTVTLTLAQGVQQGQAVMVSYTDPSPFNDGNAIQDVAGNDAATLTNQAVVNQTGTVVLPTYTLTVDQTSVNETTNNQVVVTLTADQDMEIGAQVNYNIVDRSPAGGGVVNEGADFAVSPGIFTFDTARTATVTLQLAADNLEEGTEAFVVALGDGQTESPVITIDDTSRPGGDTIVDLATVGAAYTAQDGLVEVFYLSFDSVNGTTAQAVAGAQANVTITGFNAAEGDILRFDDVSIPAVAAANFLNLANIAANPFADTTQIAFQPPAAGADGSIITLAGIQDATLGGATAFFEVV
jgi:uncharacterized repeat protein (TIGR02059 family)